MDGFFHSHSSRSMRDSMRAAIAEASASVAKIDARAAHREAQNVGAELDRLEMILEALWLLLKEKTGVTDEELVERIRQVDMADGKLDGKSKPNATFDCLECGRTVSRRNLRCLYCGVEYEASPFES